MAKTYYITGPDGSGKTTYLKELEQYLIGEKEYHTTLIWLRSPKIVSKPLMALCRLIGLTKYKTINGVKYGGHEFYRSKIISGIFPFLQLIDFRLKWYFKRKNIVAKSVLLFDRFAIDTLADLMVDTHRFDLHKSWIGKQFLKLIPKNTQIVVLLLKPEIIRSRKIDTKFDPHLDNKVKVYEILSKDLNLTTINNEGKKEFVLEEIIKAIDDERH